MKTIIITFIALVFSFTLLGQESEIAGHWQLTTVTDDWGTETGLEVLFLFESTGELRAGRSIDSKTFEVGTWHYNKEKKLLTMTSQMDLDFNGEASVVKLTKNELVYIKKNVTFSFIKYIPPAKPAIAMEKPVLSFEAEDFYHSEDGFDKELEASELPWKNIDILNYLKDKEEIVFQMVRFSGNSDVDTWEVSTKINYNKEENTIAARDYSYKQEDYIDMVEQFIPVEYFEENGENFRFFPEEGLDYYKVISKDEAIETSNGTLICTVVEGMGDGIQYDKVKYWMINNQPGVFAKIIGVKDSDPTPFNYTKVFTLKEVK